MVKLVSKIRPRSLFIIEVTLLSEVPLIRANYSPYRWQIIIYTTESTN